MGRLLRIIVYTAIPVSCGNGNCYFNRIDVSVEDVRGGIDVQLGQSRRGTAREGAGPSVRGLVGRRRATAPPAGGPARAGPRRAARSTQPCQPVSMNTQVEHNSMTDKTQTSLIRFFQEFC